MAPVSLSEFVERADEVWIYVREGRPCLGAAASPRFVDAAKSGSGRMAAGWEDIA
ncbi:hypothetical protein VSS74_01665 [Conexibacter stalactiti]|uniref:Uncharacterized protein n=1 Tax=Conexibacter stalactiti TaxID=1940611 RepID=A0ABU4HI92_9ACTN|nr:hypothetical protein [Conexibacter stalactiti]MDW5593026.1 hypothetical protein [Conexibacter stalactiti]MEC5033667.1 hypothetical protein [Conexibacter stalactiti]